MFEEITVEVKDAECETTNVKKAPEGYLPYNRTVLTQELIEYAAKNINETPELREKGIREMRKYIEDELNMKFEFEDDYLLCFLRVRKFDIKRACRLIKSGAQFVDSYHKMFNRHNSEMVHRVIKSNVIGFLPYRDYKGRAIVFLRAGLWNPDEICADDLIYGAMVSMHVAGENELNQVAGYVVIIDFENWSVKHIIAMSRRLIFGVQAMQNCCPCLVKEFHLLNTPAAFTITWNIVKNLLSEKIRSRFTFYKSSSTWDKLHSKIPPEILTEELGGDLGPYSHEHWVTDIDSVEKKYRYKVKMFLSRNKKS